MRGVADAHAPVLVLGKAHVTYLQTRKEGFADNDSVQKDIWA